MQAILNVYAGQIWPAGCSYSTPVVKCCCYEKNICTCKKYQIWIHDDIINE